MRTIGAVIIGYVAMAFIVFAGLTLAYLAMGADTAFRPGSFEVSVVWIAVSLAIGFGAAVLGGRVARRVGHTPTAPRALAVAIVVLGALFVMPVLFGSPEPPGPRTGSLGAMDAMEQARTPLWIMLLNPIIGALGALIGGGALKTEGRGAGVTDGNDAEIR